MRKKKCASLFDLFGLEFDRLPVDKDTLTLVGLGASPFPDLGSKLGYNALVDTLQQNSGGLRCAGLDALGNPQFDGMRVSDLQRNEFLTRVGALDRSRLVLDCRPVSDTNHTQNTNVAF